MTGANIECIIADDHPLMREIVRIRVEAAGIRVVGEAQNGSEAIEIITELRPHIAVVDLKMPDATGLEIVTHIAASDVPTKILLYSQDANPHVVKRSLDAGACGYLNKTSGQEMLTCALQTVIAGGCFVDPTLTASLLRPAMFSLSPRELEVLALMSEGLQNKVIAVELNLSEETVKSHVSSLMVKLGVSSRTGAVGIALRENLVA